MNSGYCLLNFLPSLMGKILLVVAEDHHVAFIDFKSCYSSHFL